MHRTTSAPRPRASIARAGEEPPADRLWLARRLAMPPGRRPGTVTPTWRPVNAHFKCGNSNSGAGGDRPHDRRIMSPMHRLAGSPTCADVPAITSAVPRFARFARIPLARSCPEKRAKLKCRQVVPLLGSSATALGAAVPARLARPRMPAPPSALRVTRDDRVKAAAEVAAARLACSRAMASSENFSTDLVVPGAAAGQMSRHDDRADPRHGRRPRLHRGRRLDAARACRVGRAGRALPLPGRPAPVRRRQSSVVRHGATTRTASPANVTSSFTISSSTGTVDMCLRRETGGDRRGVSGIAPASGRSSPLRAR